MLLFKRYWIHLGLALLPVFHLLGVFRHDYSRWKGGSFGMYSELHHSNRKVIFHTERKDIFPHGKITAKNLGVETFTQFDSLLSGIQIHPNQANAIELINFMNGLGKSDMIKGLEIWKPKYDSQKYEITWHRIFSYGELN